MVRRLAHHVVDGYRTDPMITDLVDTTELWFVPVANPDGYDFTFTPGNRLWRKNLRDNDGDGRITANDGVDLNRNYPTKWGYDDEGSSPDGGSQAYRGSGPASEPETQAARPADGAGRLRVPRQLPLRLRGRAVRHAAGRSPHPRPTTPSTRRSWATPPPPPFPATTSGLSADLYTANGILDEHAHTGLRHARGARRDEHLPDRRRRPIPPIRGIRPAAPIFLEFPDDEALIEAEFRKNLPFALSIARSAADPADPVTVTGRQAPEFVVDSFDVSYGDPQTVAVTARRDQHNQRLEYRVNGGRTQRARVGEWKGGERYGDERDRYYAELRGEGDRHPARVTRWRCGSPPAAPVATSRASTSPTRSPPTPMPTP